jgi:anti-sigma regulatory factor (Ser/Thr protein kinase)
LGALEVRHDPTSAALVRHSIADDLERRALTPESIADVVLVASELVGNAVLHTGSRSEDLDVRWRLDDDTVTVEVGDASATLPHLQQPGTGAPSGRGLTIVAAVADEWGVRRSDQGKQVWARVPVVRR